MIALLLLAWWLISWFAHDLIAQWGFTEGEWLLGGVILFVGTTLVGRVENAREEIAKLTKEVEWQRVALGRKR